MPHMGTRDQRCNITVCWWRILLCQALVSASLVLRGRMIRAAPEALNDVFRGYFADDLASRYMQGLCSFRSTLSVDSDGHD